MSLLSVFAANEPSLSSDVCLQFQNEFLLYPNVQEAAREYADSRENR